MSSAKRLPVGQRHQRVLAAPDHQRGSFDRAADLPDGRSESHDDTFRQLFRRFYRAVEDPAAAIECPQFVDGLRQLQILDAELASTAARAWLDVPA
jgi:hypothetical protein